MFLTRTLHRLHRDERGVALPAVMGLMAVGVLLSTAVAGSVVISAGYSTSTRAGVQSESAAAAGIAAARAGLVAGTCAAQSGTYASASNPHYLATVWVPSGSSWIASCPTNTATQVRILSTGYAAATSTDGGIGDTTSLEAILSAGATTTQTTTTTGPVQLTPSGPAIYAYSSQGFSGSGSLVSVDGSSPDIMVATGNVSCSGAASGAADLVVLKGNVTLSGSCNVVGNLWTTGTASISGGVSVGGNVVSTGSVGISSGTVGGTLWSGGALTMSGGSSVVKGNVTAGSVTFSGGGTVGMNAWIYGATTMDWGSKISGNVTTKTYSAPAYSSGLVGGTVTTTSPSTPGASPYPTPTFPVVPNWVDFAYHASDWAGFTEVPITSTSTCTYAQILQAVNSHVGTPIVINALGCAGGIAIGGSDKVPMTADLAIISNAFSLTGSGGFTSSAAHRLFLVTPDSVADGLPTCPSGGSFNISGGFTASSTISIMMYSPCQISLASGLNLYGQVFSGQAGVSGGATLHYVPVGLPGWNLNTGAYVPPSTTTTTTTTTGQESTRTLVSQRQVQQGN